MRTVTMVLAAAGIIAVAAVAHAAMGYRMKCRAKSCGYETEVRFGPLRMPGEQATGYCRKCKKFVYVSLRETKALGTVWDARTGRDLNVYACPDCKGPFAEIKCTGESSDELKYCPACGAPDFAADTTGPSKAID